MYSIISVFLNRLLVGAITLACAISEASASGNGSEQVEIQFQTRIQPVYQFVAHEQHHDFRLRRARLALKATIDDRLSTYLQSGYSEDSNHSGASATIIDAYATLKLNQNISLYAGQFLAPSLRQNITSAGSLLAIDRPGITYKALTWGTRALSKFSTSTLKNTDAGLRGNVDVRDIGVMLLSARSLNELTHYKIYFGLFEGAAYAQSERIVFRSQINFGAAEPKHIQHGYYFDNKNTFSVGLSADHQERVAINSTTQNWVNYRLLSVDTFLQQSIQKHQLTFESAWIQLDLQDADQLLSPVDMTMISNTPASYSQGHGFYLQSGVRLGVWQPWLAYEKWNSSAEIGSYESCRFGLTYFIKPRRANLKVGIEQTQSYRNGNVHSGEEKHISTLSGGLFFTF